MGDLFPLGKETWGLGDWQLQPDPAGGWVALGKSPTQPPLWARTLGSLRWLVLQWEDQLRRERGKGEYAMRRRAMLAAGLGKAARGEQAELAAQPRRVSDRVRRILDRRRQEREQEQQLAAVQ